MTRRTRPDRPAGRARPAFTLPELLVVVVVTLVLMSILTKAVTIMTQTISDVKAQGDFVAHERAAMEVLRRDLQQEHFLPEDGQPPRGPKLRDQRTDRLYPYLAAPSDYRIGLTGGYTPPKAGYFAACAAPVDGTTNVDEGYDSELFQSTRSGNHFLQFTVVGRSAGTPGGTFTADVPFGTGSDPISGTCVEVAYFLEDNGTTPGGTKKYKLIRRQRLCARDADDRPVREKMLNDLAISPGVKEDDPPEVMAVRRRTPQGTVPPQFDMFDLGLLTQPGNRGPRQSIQARPPGVPKAYRVGEDVLNYNVTSFEVKFTGTCAPWMSGSWPRPFYNPPGVVSNSDYPYDTLPGNGYYDTFSSQDPRWVQVQNNQPQNAQILNGATNAQPNAPLSAVRITGVMIKLRYWNQSTKSTRQTTIAVDL